MDFRTKFTKWYYKKGYKVDYEPCDYADGIGHVNYACPWWIKPLTAYFFAPSVYYAEAWEHVKRMLVEVDEMYKETACETE